MRLTLINSFIKVSFFTTIFVVMVLKPLRDFDIWFHLKSGEIILKMGLIRYDVFSHSASGREWFPYEWLFQIIVYFWQQSFGFEAIKFLVAAVVVIQLLAIYLILRKVFNLNWFLALFACFLFFVSIYEFLNARPHTFAYTFLIINLGLILSLYFKKEQVSLKKNLLWFSIPITLAWANLHGSIFLDIALFAGYGSMALVIFIITKEKNWFDKSKILFFFSILTSIVSVLPPLGIIQYRLLWVFFQKRDFISKFIDEWAPLDVNPFGFKIFTLTVVLVFGLSLIYIIRKRSFKDIFWIIPLTPFIFFTYTASRNLFLAYIALTFIFGWLISQMNLHRLSKLTKISLALVLIAITIFHLWLMSLKLIQIRLYYPVHATEFIKDYKLSGNMFNEYGYGGYLLYHLYPDYKVFYDGRTDVYLCCEMPDTLGMATKKNLPDNEYKAYLDWLWNKYHISYVILRTQKHTAIRRIARILTDDPSWNLVFWDDHSQIFVRKDGKNNQVLEKFQTLAVTPYNKNPFREGQKEQALAEYQRIIKVADSAKSRNAIGFIFLQNQQFDQARQQFEIATQLDSTNESPFMNLAELEAKDGNLEEAIKLYSHAINLAPDRGLAYIRLGQLFLEKTGKIEEAKKIWQIGLKETVDDEAKEKLKQLLSL